MQTRALIEISADMDAEMQRCLISTAYRWSRSGLVALALERITRQSVDRVLNPVVSEVGLNVCGVVYIDGADAAEITRYLSPETVAFAVSEALRSHLRARGIAPLSPEDAVARPQDPVGPIAAPQSLSAVA